MLGLRQPKRLSHVAADERHQKACSALLKDADCLPVSERTILDKHLQRLAILRHVDAIECCMVTQGGITNMRKSATFDLQGDMLQ